jgi:glyoxalase family protein
MFTTEGFHHVTMVVRDAARTVRFYRDLLGMHLVKQTVNYDDPGSYHLYFGDATGSPGTILTFFEWPQAGKGNWGVGGVHHVALEVGDAEAQLKWKRWLMDRGVAVTGPYDRGWFRSIYFEDPDGQILEIATTGPGYTVDEPIESLGQQICVPRQDQLSGGRDEDAIDSATYAEPVARLTGDMTLRGIHHVTGMTPDLERANDFYERALGLRLVKRSINQDDPGTAHWFWGHYDGKSVGSHSSLTFFGWPTSTYAARPGVGQTHHIAFRARDDEQQLEWREHLVSIGSDVSPVMDRGYFRSIYFHAPDGLLLEIATDKPGFAVDEPADALGRELRLPDWLEPRHDEIATGLGALP